MSDPATPHADQFALHLATVTAAHAAGTLSAIEVAMNIIEYLAQGSTVKDLDAEHAAVVASQQPPPAATFTCPLCGRISHNPNDVANHYCGYCHVFTADADYDRLRAELQRVSAVERLLRNPRGLL